MNQTVTKWSQTGTLLLTIGYIFNQQQGYPSGVAVDSAGNIWVADSNGNSIIQFSPTGTFQQELTMAGLAVVGSPRSLFIDGSGNLWAALASSRLIVEFVFNATTVVPTHAAPGTGTSVSSTVNLYSTTSTYILYNPYGVCTDSSGNIYVGDYSAGNRVLKLSPAGTLLQTFTGLITPQGVAVDSAGNVYVANNGNSTVVKFNAAGSIVTIYGGGGGNPGPTFIYPYSVVLDSTATYIYVSDTNNQSVVKMNQLYADRTSVACVLSSLARLVAHVAHRACRLLCVSLCVCAVVWCSSCGSSLERRRTPTRSHSTRPTICMWPTP